MPTTALLSLDPEEDALLAQRGQYAEDQSDGSLTIESILEAVTPAMLF